MTRVGDALRRKTWREWGFDLSDEEMEQVERFFERWHPTYSLPGVQPYRCQEVLFASFNGLVLLFGDELNRREQRNGVSASRAGYCVGLVEDQLGLRPRPDPNLEKLLRLMEQESDILVRAREQNEHTTLGAALVRSRHLTDVVISTVVERPEIARDFKGFPLREAVFAEISHTLFVKLKITAFPSRLDNDQAELAMRYGHALAVCEEALPVRSARGTSPA